MTLRVRLSLILAALTGFTAIVVALAGFQVASSRLSQEATESLINTSRRFAIGPDSRFACGLGETLARGITPAVAPAISRGSATSSDAESRSGRQRSRRDRDRSLAGDGQGSRLSPGLIVQCLDITGSIVFASPGRSLPVDDRDRALAKAQGADRLRKTTIDDARWLILTTSVQRPGDTLGAVQIARSLEENDRVIASLLSRYVIVAVSAMAAAALIGLVLAKRTVRPIHDLTAAAERIASTGDLSVQLNTSAKGKDESGRLAHAFVTMVSALRSSREQQARLVQDAGHELRTPLTSLRTNVALLRRPDLPEAKRLQILDSLRDELVELTTLTNELVALAATSSNPEAFQQVDLTDVVSQAVQRCERRTGRTFVTDLPACQVVGQPASLARSFDNLVGNAAKFSPDGPIEVSIRNESSVAIVRVRDHGPGIAADDLPHVFERFYRADASRTMPGSGLGLAIVHDAVAAHGGAVTASNAPGGGAVFEVSLPRERK